MQWVQNCQQQSYLREIASVKSKPVRSRIKKPPLVRQFRLFADDAGLLCCGGQIYNASLGEVAKFPYLLPQTNHLTLLIVNHVRVFLSYTGVGSTLTALRQSSGYLKDAKMSRNCYTAVHFVGNMEAGHMPLQSRYHSQRSGCRMCHHSPSQV